MILNKGLNPYNWSPELRMRLLQNFRKNEGKLFCQNCSNTEVCPSSVTLLFMLFRVRFCNIPEFGREGEFSSNTENGSCKEENVGWRQL